jgi:SAM-dependent methyltransferase
MDLQKHWSDVYQTKAPDNVSWYQETPELSLKLIRQSALAKTAPLIDVGAGASTLVDHLADYENISLLDISAEALEISKKRLGEKAAAFKWLVGDICQLELPQAYFALWHDRAVFHFLTTDDAQKRYHQQLMQSLAPKAYVIMATFAKDGPEQCSGLNVMRYDAEALQAFLGDAFDLLGTYRESHITPWASEQKFVYCHFRKRD